MIAENNHENVRQLRNLQWVVLAISVLFACIIGNGYYNLSINRGALFAICTAVLLTSIAWGLAKFIGSSEHGIKGNAPLFVMLIILSAVGVFNALMINLEGHRIFQEAIDAATQRFREVPPVAVEALQDPKIIQQRERIEDQKVALKQEIENPLNCGAGPAARKIMDDIAHELPGFTVLSGTLGNCARAPEVAVEYLQQIDQLEDQYLEKSGNKALVAERQQILADEATAEDHLHQLEKSLNDGINLLTVARPAMEELASDYQGMAAKLYRYPAGKQLKPSLDISAVRNLGEWSQVINLIVSRLDKVQTYIYIFLAGFADWLLVHLFYLLRRLRRNVQPVRADAPQTVSNLW